jgi:hypothetical protein
MGDWQVLILPLLMHQKAGKPQLAATCTVLPLLCDTQDIETRFE